MVITFLPSFVLGCYAFRQVYFHCSPPASKTCCSPYLAHVPFFCFPSWMLTSSLTLFGPF